MHLSSFMPQSTSVDMHLTAVKCYYVLQDTDVLLCASKQELAAFVE